MSSANGDRGKPESGHRYLLLASIGIVPFLVSGPINAGIAHRPGLYWSFELLTWVAAPLLLL